LVGIYIFYENWSTETFHRKSILEFPIKPFELDRGWVKGVPVRCD
jgi:hypothetical protein